VLDAKGGENKAKARNGSATTWGWNGSATTWGCLKKVELEFLFVKNFNCLFVVSFVKSWSLVGRRLDYGKRGSFWIFDQILLKYLSLCFNKCIWLRDRKLSLICKNKPSGGKEWSIYAKFESKQFCVFICIDVALLLVAFYCVGINHQKGGDWKGVGINHQKGGDWKGNVPWGHF
jgi:hypothetical protein